MNKFMMIMLVSILAGAFGQVRAEEPLAPIAKLDDMFGPMVDAAEREVPDTSAVGIPAYPESQFCTIKVGSWGEQAWSEVNLLSTSSYAEVIAWYRDKMDGWYCKEWSEGASFSCSDKDPGPAGNYDPETSNVVSVSKTDVAIPCTLEGMQTGITIQFQPD